MNSTFRHIDKTIIHFNRWSNKSYAIFNSVGKQVEIGFLSGIIQNLQTVKSCISIQLIDFINKGNENEASEGSIADENSILDAEVAVWIGKLGLVNNANAGSDQEQFSVLICKYTTKASLRPLLFFSRDTLLFFGFFVDIK